MDCELFREQGSALIAGLFSRDEVDGVREDAKTVFRRQLERHDLLDGDDGSEPAFEAALYRYFEGHTAEFANCGKQAQHLLSLHRFSLDARVLAVLTALGLEQPNISVRPVLFFNSRHLAAKEFYWRTPAHQDWRSMQGSLDSVVVWVALVDVDNDLGALQVVPGSHTEGLLTERFADGFGQTDRFSDDDFIPVEMAKGDALFFSSFLVHRSGVNTTEAIRWSAQFRYNNLADPSFVQRGYPHSFIYKPTEELLTPGFPTREDLRRVFP